MWCLKSIDSIVVVRWIHAFASIKERLRGRVVVVRNI